MRIYYPYYFNLYIYKMKYQKKFRINDNPKKIHLRIQIVKGYLKGKSLSEIARSENCTIKTAKIWVDRSK